MVWGKNITNEFYITNRNDSFDGIAQWAGRPATYGVTSGQNFEFHADRPVGMNIDLNSSSRSEIDPLSSPAARAGSGSLSRVL